MGNRRQAGFAPGEAELPGSPALTCSLNPFRTHKLARLLFMEKRARIMRAQDLCSRAESAERRGPEDAAHCVDIILRGHLLARRRA